MLKSTFNGLPMTGEKFCSAMNRLSSNLLSDISMFADRRPVGKRFDEKYTSATMKHPPSQMIWGAMSKNGTAGLYFLTPGTTMNGSKYVDLLKSKLLLHMSVRNTSIFMQDGAPCHRSKIVKKFLGDNNVMQRFAIRKTS